MRHLAVAGAIVAASLALAAVALCRAPDLVVSQELADEPAPPLEGGRRVSQTFTAAADGLDYLELRLATYESTPEGRLQVVLRELGSSDNPVADWSLPGRAIEDNDWHRFELPWVGGVAAGSVLEVELSRDQPEGRPVTVWTGTGDPYREGALSVDGQAIGGDMAFRAGYQRACSEAAQARLAGTGYRPAVAAALLVGLFALPLAFLYTYRLTLSGR